MIRLTKRIIEELKRIGKKPAELIRYLDLPRGVFATWKAGRSRYYCEHLGAIAQFLGVSVEYLVLGYVSDKKTINIQEDELLEYFRYLNQEKKVAVLQNIKWLACVEGKRDFAT